MANATLEEKEAKAAGKFRGFRVEILCASLEELDKLLPHLGKSLEVGTLRGERVFMKKVEKVYPSSVILHLQQKPMCLLIQGFFMVFCKDHFSPNVSNPSHRRWWKTSLGTTLTS